MMEGNFTEGRGAYLARAIPEKWGPPKQFKARQRQAEAAQAANARQSHEEARKRDEAARWTRTLAQLQESRPAAFQAFLAHVESERRAEVERKRAEGMKPFFLERLSKHYASADKRHELFERWYPEHEQHEATHAPDVPDACAPETHEDPAAVSAAIAASLGRADAQNE
jgi:hypothetical protein